MGLLDRVKSFGSNVVNTVKDTGQKVQNTASQAASVVQNTVQDTFETVKQTAQAVRETAVGVAANPSVIPDKAASVAKAVSHSWYNQLNSAADNFGGALRSAGGLLEQGGTALKPFVPFASEAVTLGRAAQLAGQGIADAPENSIWAANELLGGVNALHERASDFLRRAEGVVDTGVNAAREALDTARRGVDAVGNAVTGFISEVARATDYAHNIDQLGPNDTYRLAVGGSGSVEGGKLYGAGAIEVTRNPEGRYVVSVDGELGGGLYGEVGGKLGAKLNAEASATLGVGGRVEMSFATAEEAKRATEILLKQSAAAAARSAAGPLAGTVVSQALAPSSEELQFLADHTSAIELRGNVAADIAGNVGLKNVAGLFGSAKVKDEVAVRIELRDANGRPKQPELVVRQTVTGEASGSAGFLATDGAQQSTGGRAVGVGARGQVKVEVEQRWTLPNVSGADLMADPLGTVRGARDRMVQSQQDKITLGLDVSGQAFGNGGGVRAEVSYSGNFDALQSSAIDRLREGDLSGALRTIDSGTASVKVEPYGTIGVAYAPGISIMGFGVGAEFEATRRDVADPPARFERSGKPSELATEFGEQLRPYLPAVRTGPPPQVRG